MQKTNLVPLPCSVVEDLLPKVLSGQASQRTTELVNAHIRGKVEEGIHRCKACALVRSVIADELESAGRDRHKGAAPFQTVQLIKMRTQITVLHWSILSVLILLSSVLYASPHARMLLLLVPVIGALGFVFTRKSWIMPLCILGIPLLAPITQYIFKHDFAFSLPLTVFSVIGAVLGVVLAFCAYTALGHAGLFHSRYIRLKRVAMRFLAAGAAVLLIVIYVYVIVFVGVSPFPA